MSENTRVALAGTVAVREIASVQEDVICHILMCFSPFSPLRQARDQAERADLLPGNRGGLLRSPAQRHQGEHLCHDILQQT